MSQCYFSCSLSLNAIYSKRQKCFFHTRISPFSLLFPPTKHHNTSHGSCIEEFHSETQQCCGDLSNLSFLKPSTKNLKASHISWFMCQKVSDHGWKLQCCESLGPVSFFKSKNSWMGFLCVTKEFKFPLRILRSAPAGRSRGLQHKQDPADGDRTHSQRQINSSLQWRLGWPRNPICSLSRVTQQSHIRPFTLPLLGLLPLALRVWGPWVSGSLCDGVCMFVCVCAVDTKEGDLIWHESRLENPVSTGGSTMLTVLQLPINCHLSQVRLLNGLRRSHFKKKKSSIGFFLTPVRLIKSLKRSTNWRLLQRNVPPSSGQVTTTCGNNFSSPFSKSCGWVRGLDRGIYCHARGGTRNKVEPEFPDPFLCRSLCRQANTSPRSNAHTPAAGGKKEAREGEKKEL